MHEEMENKSVVELRNEGLPWKMKAYLLNDSRSTHFLHFDSNTASESPRSGIKTECFVGVAKAPARRSI